MLTKAIIDLATEYRRYGYRRVTALLNRQGWRVNHKRARFVSIVYQPVQNRICQCLIAVGNAGLLELQAYPIAGFN